MKWILVLLPLLCWVSYVSTATYTLNGYSWTTSTSPTPSGYIFSDISSPASTSELLSAILGTAVASFPVPSYNLNSQQADLTFYILGKQGSTVISGETVNFNHKVKLEENGIVVAFTQLYTSGTSLHSITSDSFVFLGTVYGTESGDTVVDPSDTWVIGQTADNFVLVANGYTDGQSFPGNRIRGTFTGLTFPTSAPGISILRVIKLTPSLTTVNNFATNVVSYGFDLYTYVPASGVPLLNFLTPAELQTVINWDFANAGVGGDPHVWDFDGAHFELPSTEQTYCFYADHKLHVNIRVGNYGLITEIVMFLRQENHSIRATLLENCYPQYFVNDVLVGEDTQHDFLSMVTGAFPSQGPLGELVRYHQNRLLIKPYSVIVGGCHPQMGGFFNTVVNLRSGDFTVPSVLQLRHQNRLGDGDLFSEAVIPHLWHMI